MKAEGNRTSKTLSELPTAPRSRPLRQGPVPIGTFQNAWLVLLAALVMTVLEGAFRKWVFPQGGAVKYLLYFSKDILFAAILFFPKRSQPSPALKGCIKWLLTGCALIGLGAALSAANGVNPVGAVLTIRALIVLPVIAWLVIPRLAGLPLRWSAGLLAAFALLNFALGMEQNRLPRYHLLNRYADAEMEVVEVESGVRAAGTFAYIAGLAVISTVGIWAGLVLMSVAKTPWQRLGAWVSLASGFGCGLASVSRAPVALGVAIVAGWLLSFRESVSLLVRGLVMGVFCLALAYTLGLFPVLTKLGVGLKERNETAGDSFQERAFGQISETVDVLQSVPRGHGLGTEQIGGQYYATGVAGFNNFESQFPRLVMECGLSGLIGYLIIAAGAIIALQRAKLGASAESKATLLATQLFLGAMFYGNVVFNHIASAFCWIIFAAAMAAAEQTTELAGVEQNRNTELQGSQQIRPVRKYGKRAITWLKKTD
jgi:hypothetical protein